MTGTAQAERVQERTPGLLEQELPDDNLPKITDWRPCRVRDGLFVEPCQSLAKAVDGNGRARQGLEQVTWMNLKTGKPTRSFIVVHSGTFGGKGGIIVNHCPFCGVDICDPVRTEDERANTRSVSDAEVKL